MFGDARAHLRGNVGEAAVTPFFGAKVAINQAGIFVGLADGVTVDLRVDVTVDLHEVGPAIVVVIKKSAAPGDVAVVDANTGGESDIGESAVTVVVIEVAGIVGKIGFEDVE